MFMKNGTAKNFFFFAVVVHSTVHLILLIFCQEMDKVFCSNRDFYLQPNMKSFLFVIFMFSKITKKYEIVIFATKYEEFEFSRPSKNAGKFDFPKCQKNARNTN